MSMKDVRENERKVAAMRQSLCPNCKRPGSHFAPPSFGEKGFYICEPKSQ
jgi:hypothetical protein